jgi:beta-lactamase regulating signal transducer with metallopeptidase domain
MNHLVASLWQGVLIAAITTLAVRVVPPGAASKRHLIWWVALALTLLVPFVDRFGSSAARQLELGPVEAVDTTVFTLPMPPMWFIFGSIVLWACVAVAHVCRLALGVRALGRLVDSSSPFDAGRLARFTRYQTARHSGRSVELRLSNDIAGACAVGLGRPTIVVSAPLAAAMNDEYAHLQRYDEWARLGQCLVLAFTKWHPAVLWISRHIDVEREIACDQHVVAETGAPIAYARSLAQAAEVIAGARGAAPMLAPGSSTTTPMLRLRVERLLGLPPARKRPFAMCMSASAIAVVVVATMCLSQIPWLVTFTARVAQASTPATLASVSLLTDLFPNKLPSVFANRGADIAGSSEPSVLPVEQAPVALPDPVPVSIQASVLNDSVAVRDAITPEVTAPVVASAHLASTSIPFIARVPQVESAPTAEAGGVDWAALGRPPTVAGLAIARAGTATGVAASKAGTAVSRFFKNGGLAFARSF